MDIYFKEDLEDRDRFLLVLKYGSHIGTRLSDLDSETIEFTDITKTILWDLDYEDPADEVLKKREHGLCYPAICLGNRVTENLLEKFGLSVLKDFHCPHDAYIAERIISFTLRFAKNQNELEELKRNTRFFEVWKKLSNGTVHNSVSRYRALAMFTLLYPEEGVEILYDNFIGKIHAGGSSLTGSRMFYIENNGRKIRTHNYKCRDEPPKRQIISRTTPVRTYPIKTPVREIVLSNLNERLSDRVEVEDYKAHNFIQFIFMYFRTMVDHRDYRNNSEDFDFLLSILRKLDQHLPWYLIDENTKHTIRSMAIGFQDLFSVLSHRYVFDDSTIEDFSPVMLEDQSVKEKLQKEIKTGNFDFHKTNFNLYVNDFVEFLKDDFSIYENTAPWYTLSMKDWVSLFYALNTKLNKPGTFDKLYRIFEMNVGARLFDMHDIKMLFDEFGSDTMRKYFSRYCDEQEVCKAANLFLFSDSLLSDFESVFGEQTPYILQSHRIFLYANRFFQNLDFQDENQCTLSESRVYRKLYDLYQNAIKWRLFNYKNLDLNRLVTSNRDVGIGQDFFIFDPEDNRLSEQQVHLTSNAPTNRYHRCLYSNNPYIKLSNRKSWFYDMSKIGHRVTRHHLDNI